MSRALAGDNWILQVYPRPGQGILGVGARLDLVKDLSLYLPGKNLKVKTEEAISDAYTRGRTYVMITYVSKENNLGPDDKIRYIWDLKGLIFNL